MAVNYRTTLKTTRMQAVVDDIDRGSGPGTLEIATASYASILATFTLDLPSSVVAGAVLTFSGLTKTAVAANSGTAAVARIKDYNGNVIVNNLTVGTSGTDIIISPSTTITASQDVDWTAGTITHAT